MRMEAPAWAAGQPHTHSTAEPQAEPQFPRVGTALPVDHLPHTGGAALLAQPVPHLRQQQTAQSVSGHLSLLTLQKIPKESSFMWISAISIDYIQNEKCEIFTTQEFTSTH